MKIMEDIDAILYMKGNFEMGKNGMEKLRNILKSLI